MGPPRPDPGRLAHLITGTAEEQVQDAAERREEDDDGRPRSLRQAACMVCLGQAADLATVQRGVGVGEPLSLGIAATVTAAAFALALWRCLRAARLRTT